MLTFRNLLKNLLGPRVGSVVVMRPGNGEILAMVSYPRYDPSEFLGTTGGSGVSFYLALDERSPFLNRVIQSVAAPASTFKVVMTTAILEEDAFPPEQTINCTGTFPYGNRVFNDWLEYGHGPVNLTAALAQSCNVYYWTMGSQYLSVDQIIDYSARLGLGTPNQALISPERLPALFPLRYGKSRRSTRVGLAVIRSTCRSERDSLQVSPIQQAGMVAAIVNDGVMFRPHLSERDSGSCDRCSCGTNGTGDYSGSVISAKKRLRKSVPLCAG